MEGVTGAETDFSGALDTYLGRCRARTTLPIAVGFGAKELSARGGLRVVLSTSLARIAASGEPSWLEASARPKASALPLPPHADQP